MKETNLFREQYFSISKVKPLFHVEKHKAYPLKSPARIYLNTGRKYHILINGQSYNIPSKSILFLLEGSKIRTDRFYGYCININLNLLVTELGHCMRLNSNELTIRFRNKPVLVQKDFESFLELITPLVKGNYNKTVAHKYILLSAINFIYDRSDESKNNEEVVNNFIRLLSQDYKKNNKIRDYAKNLFVSKEKLYKSCKRDLKMSPKQILEEKRLSMLRTEILNSEYSLGDLALEYNFSDRSHLTRFFKSKTGHTPIRYKNIQKRY